MSSARSGGSRIADRGSRIADREAVDIARAFYAALPTAPGPAHALHEAVRVLRDRARTAPSLWAAHLHAGA
ncbi:CHAT domain-containing protein [Streptomyces sp. NPDC051183]|uniref:CHAT domain-containing protein n=1 Tax=Streptomyces sp. NPDC051183 TaxID=3155165 RepID=UPI003427A901